MTSMLGSFNGLVLDGVQSSSTELFSTLDPAHERLLAWAKQTLISELNLKGWETATAGTTLDGKCPVQTILHREPEPSYLKTIKTGFPLLYCYPREGATRDYTLEKTATETTWRFGYVLGALAPEEYTRLAAALRAFPRLIALMFSARAHPDYQDGADQFDENTVNFTSIRMTRHQYGAATFADQGNGVTFYVSELELVTTEVQGFADSSPVISGFDVGARVDGITDLVKGRLAL